MALVMATRLALLPAARGLPCLLSRVALPSVILTRARTPSSFGSANVVVAGEHPLDFGGGAVAVEHGLCHE